jgi:hypothetical protein
MLSLRTFLIASVGAVAVAGTTKPETVRFLQKNLVSDGSVPAVITDPGFLNPWASQRATALRSGSQSTGVD